MAVLSPQVLMQPSCLPVWVTTIPRSSSLWSCRSNFCPLHLSTSRLHSKRMWFDLPKNFSFAEGFLSQAGTGPAQHLAIATAMVAPAR